MSAVPGDERHPADGDTTPRGGFVAYGSVIVVLLAVALLILVFRDTAAGMVRTWSNSVTYNHGFLIVPISLGLLWLRRRALASVVARPDAWALPVLAGAAFAWLLGDIVDVNVVREFALVTMLLALVWLIVGPAAMRVMAFPLGFLYFAVPFGDFLVMPLMVFTADVTVALVRFTGIPVFREGLYFALPTGTWAVVEACSGIRYLIASVTLGALYAYLMYRTFWRIALFMALAVIIPIIANALRAYMIVMIGHLSGMELAVGVDHLLYGWLFFGAVIFLMFWVGSFFRQDGVISHRQGNPAAQTATTGAASLRVISVVAVGGLAVAVLFPVLASVLDDPSRYPQPALQAPAASGSWEAVDAELTWQPAYTSARATTHQVYADAGEARAYAFSAYYNDQRRTGDLLYWRNQVVDRRAGDYRVMDSRGRSVPMDVPGRVREFTARGPEGDFIAWEWFWVDGVTTVRRWEVKAREALSRLLGRGDDAAVVVVYAYYEDDPDEARSVLESFLGDMSPAIHRSLDDANAR